MPAYGSESVEYLVKRSVVEMDGTDMPGDRSPTTTCWMFDCLSAREKVQGKREGYAHRRASRRIGVEREMRVQYTQPHLVEPMKLTVYDEMPYTPIIAQQPPHASVSSLVTHGRKSISRASTRASLAVRRRTHTRRAPEISKPQPAAQIEGCQIRRNPSFRPIQLSIYVEECKRLSDLPEFDAVSFTEEGAIKVPPRAVIRTQSEELLRPRSPTMRTGGPLKPASMFEQSLSRRVSLSRPSHVRQRTESTCISTSRPSSAYDALHSHPVSWYELPGIPPVMQFATAPTRSRTNILTPMAEEFTPPASGAVIIDGRVLAFPEVDAHRESSEDLPASPVVNEGKNRRTMVVSQHKPQKSEVASIMLGSSSQVGGMRRWSALLGRAKTEDKARADERAGAVTEAVEQSRSYFHTDLKTNDRINQWLENDTKDADIKGRSRESSISTIKTSTTSSSFAEHRRKRSQFYGLNQVKPAVTTPTTSPTEEKEIPRPSTAPSTTKVHKTPTPLKLYGIFPPPQKPAQPKPSVHVAAHHHAKSSSSLKSHARTQTISTVASTIATDVLFEGPETPELESDDVFTSAQALPQQTQRAARDADAESMTTVDMKSRTGTMKSTATTSSAAAAAAPVDMEKEASEIIAVSKSGDFVFRGLTPSPDTPSPNTPLSARDVEKMMFEMCQAGGYRRVNVGVAF